MVSAQVVPAFPPFANNGAAVCRSSKNTGRRCRRGLRIWFRSSARRLGSIRSCPGSVVQPIIGPLFSILGGMVNPLGLLVNLFGALSPLVTVLGAAFSPLGVTVAALVTGFVGIADAVGKYNELFGTGTTAVEQLRACGMRSSRRSSGSPKYGAEALAVVRGLWPQIERIQVKVGELASLHSRRLGCRVRRCRWGVGQHARAAFDAFVAGPAAAMFNVIEAIIDLLNGEFSGATAIIKEAMAGLVSVGVMFAETSVKFGEYLGIEEEYRAGARKT